MLRIGQSPESVCDKDCFLLLFVYKISSWGVAACSHAVQGQSMLSVAFIWRSKVKSGVYD